MKTNKVSFDNTNEESFCKTGKAGFTRAFPIKQITLLGLSLCAGLSVALPGMSQPLQADSGQAASASSGQALPVVEVYKDPECGCCKAWAEHLRKNGFTVILHDVDDVPAARKRLGMPNRFGSCHTARAGQYLIEGHVPAADIKRLLKERPQAGSHGAIGLAVPSMPPGSPGMEGERSIPYDTLLVTADGNARVFARH